MTTPTSTPPGEHDDRAHSPSAAEKADDVESAVPASPVDADSALQFPEGGAKAWLAVLGGYAFRFRKGSPVS